MLVRCLSDPTPPCGRRRRTQQQVRVGPDPPSPLPCAGTSIIRSGTQHSFAIRSLAIRSFAIYSFAIYSFAIVWDYVSVFWWFLKVFHWFSLMFWYFKVILKDPTMFSSSLKKCQRFDFLPTNLGGSLNIVVGSFFWSIANECRVGDPKTTRQAAQSMHRLWWQRQELPAHSVMCRLHVQTPS